MRTASILVLLLVAASSVCAADRNLDVLKGLGRTLCVQVGDLGADAEKSGLTAEALRASLVEELTKARFQVDAAAPACLRVTVRTHALPATGFVSHYVELALVEEVSPIRTGAPRLATATWSHGTVGTSLTGRLASAARTTASSSVAVFADDYQLVNGGQ